MVKTESEMFEELYDRVRFGGLPNSTVRGESIKPEIIVESAEELRIVRNGDEQDTMESLAESIFSGNINSDDSDTGDDDDAEKDTDSEDEEGAEETNDSGDSDDESEEDSKEDGEDADSDDDDDDKSDFGGDSDGKSNGPFTSKIRTLQKQYNDLLIDAFEKYAPECIEDALDETESTFGENIEDILQSALDKLKSKIMDDLGVEGSSGLEGLGGIMPPAAMGSFDPVAGTDKPMEIKIQKGV